MSCKERLPTVETMKSEEVCWESRASHFLGHTQHLRCSSLLATIIIPICKILCEASLCVLINRWLGFGSLVVFVILQHTDQA